MDRLQPFTSVQPDLLITCSLTSLALLILEWLVYFVTCPCGFNPLFLFLAFHIESDLAFLINHIRNSLTFMLLVHPRSILLDSYLFMLYVCSVMPCIWSIPFTIWGMIWCPSLHSRSLFMSTVHPRLMSSFLVSVPCLLSKVGKEINSLSTLGFMFYCTEDSYLSWITKFMPWCTVSPFGLSVGNNKVFFWVYHFLF